MKTTTNKTNATNDAVSRVAEIAKRQRRITEILNAAAAEVETLASANTLDEREIERLVTRGGADVKAIGKALAANQARVSDMSSRMVDAIERRGQRVWPERYEPIAKPWCIVSNNF